MNIRNSGWITASRETRDICPVFRRVFSAKKPVLRAELSVTVLGVYFAELNGRPVGDFVLAPGWTSYSRRLQVQVYDVTGLLREENDLRVTVGRGWFRSPIPGWMDSDDKQRRFRQPCGVIARLCVRYTDGTEESIGTDGAWEWAESPVRFSEIYDGERCDARVVPENWQAVSPLDWSKEILIPQEGEIVRETERIPAKQILRTPAGETVVDFGQEVTGYEEIMKTVSSHIQNTVLALFACVVFIGSCILSSVDITPKTPQGQPLIAAVGIVFSIALGIYTVKRMTKKK